MIDTYTIEKLDPLSDKQIVDRIINNCDDEAAFFLIHHRHIGMLIKLLQEQFTSIPKCEYDNCLVDLFDHLKGEEGSYWKKLSSFNWKYKFSTWFYQVAYNRFFDYLKEYIKQNNITIPLSENQSNADYSDYGDNIDVNTAQEINDYFSPKDDYTDVYGHTDTKYNSGFDPTDDEDMTDKNTCQSNPVNTGTYDERQRIAWHKKNADYIIAISMLDDIYRFIIVKKFKKYSSEQIADLLQQYLKKKFGRNYIVYQGKPAIPSVGYIDNKKEDAAREVKNLIALFDKEGYIDKPVDKLPNDLMKAFINGKLNKADREIIRIYLIDNPEKLKDFVYELDPASDLETTVSKRKTKRITQDDLPMFSCLITHSSNFICNPVFTSSSQEKTFDELLAEFISEIENM